MSQVWMLFGHNQQSWTYFGHHLDTFWGLVTFLDTLWTHFGVLRPKSVYPHIVLQCRTKPPIDFKTKVPPWIGLAWPCQAKAELFS